MNNIFQPKISIIILLDSNIQYLKNTLCSIATQTYTSYEVVLINYLYDENYLVGLLKNYCFFSKLINYKNKFINNFEALELEVTNGDYITWIHAGDLYHPYTLSAVIAALDKKQTHELIITYGFSIWEYDVNNVVFHNSEDYQQYSEFELCIPLLPLFSGLILDGGILYHKALLNCLKEFPLTIRKEIPFQMLRRFPCFYIKEELFCRNKSLWSLEDANIIQSIDKLFLKQVKSLTLKEIEAMAGNPYIFYKKILPLCIKNCYTNTASYIHKQLLHIKQSDPLSVKEYEYVQLSHMLYELSASYLFQYDKLYK